MGFLLIDTGLRSKRKRLLKILNQAGCRPENLKLIVITHGDFDHTGNGAFLHTQFRCPIAMHKDDSLMVELGDMFVNRTKGKKIVRKIINKAFQFERFKPDNLLVDGNKLNDFGWNATVIHLPGHSKGSIGIVTAEKQFFCGDLLENTKKPQINPIMDNNKEMKESISKLTLFAIDEIYPGHGRPFDAKALENFKIYLL